MKILSINRAATIASLFLFFQLSNNTLAAGLLSGYELPMVHYQDDGSIKGKVTTSDGQPAEFATIVLNGKKTAQAGRDGTFHFEELGAGTYKLAILFMGHATQEKTVVLKAGETAHVDFTLTTSARALNEILIVGDKYTITSKKQSASVGRLPLKYLENTQVYSVIDKELIREQLSVTLDESFRNVPGAAPAKTGAGIPAFFSRGFVTSDNLRNGMATFTRTTIDLATVERVEAIKGPSSTLFGASMVSFGGLVNYITKKPFDKTAGEVSYTQGSYDLSRLTADFNTPLNDNKTMLFRANVAYQQENTFQDQGHGTTIVVAPSILYKVNDRFTVRLDADMQRYKGTSSTAWIVSPGINAKSYDQLKLDYNRSLIDNSFKANMSTNNIFLQAEYKLSEQWTSTTNYAWATGGYDNMYLFDMTWLTDTTIARSIRVHAPDRMGRKHFQQNFTGDFKIGSMRNRLVVGVDFMDQYRDLKYNNLVLDTVNTLRTVKDVRVETVDARLGTLNTPETRSRQYSYGAYFSDVLNITNQLLVMASLRVDYFDNKGTKNNLTQVTTGDYKQTSFSPKFGVVYQPILNKVAIFANYMNGFKNVPNTLQPDGAVTSFKPQQANQLEGGVKLDLFENKLAATISYYDIQVKNSTRGEVRGSQVFTVQDGTQESKGVELEIIGNPLPGLNIITGYGYNENRYKKATPQLEGKRTVGAPSHVGNIWVGYSILKGAVKGLGVGAGAMYVGDAFYDPANTFVLPSYTTFDATLFYNTPKFRMAIKGNNLTGEKYWVSDGFYARPQKQSNFLVSVTFKF
ncbi:TonB-dependent receptor [Chitinophaga pendula]|uniref:TonB-dependent receptor n=1 Tax=Chitinophaga TaxID=79328 RepID=UPI000BAF9A54|nr:MULTISPECIES: TonB-dependent receptor [Chitinophaga]ASZ13344.1 TonB-dependent siderophore receptor [Chitinophaga sp. MD30]UCJ09030.1 TonB-dependent receptor [Chitinophaga pendula]